MANRELWQQWFESPLRNPLPGGGDEKRGLVRFLIHRLEWGCVAQKRVTENHDVRILCGTATVHIRVGQSLTWARVNEILDNVGEGLDRLHDRLDSLRLDDDAFEYELGSVILLEGAVDRMRAGFTMNAEGRGAVVDVDQWREAAALLVVHDRIVKEGVAVDVANDTLEALLDNLAPDLVNDTTTDIEDVLFD